MLLFLAMCMCLAMGVCTQAKTKKKTSVTKTVSGQKKGKKKTTAKAKKTTAKCKVHHFNLRERREPTFATPGSQKWVCKNCGAMQVITIPQKKCEQYGGHRWSAYQKTGKTKYNIGGLYKEYKRRCYRCGATARIWSK